MRESDTDWVHDDAVKNYEFWISWKRAQLLERKRHDGTKALSLLRFGDGTSGR
jgi:hypothetical protein